MLILYKKSERQFLSNGIGRLDKHAFDDKVREELNGIYKLEFTYPIHAPHSKDIKNDNIVRATVPDGEQPFFISRIVKKDGYLRVTAYHLFYRLIWQLIEDINIVNLNGQAALNRVLENTEFTGVSDISTTKNIRIVRYNAVEAILNPGKDNTLISRFGGELKRDKLTVMLMNRIGRTYENNPVEIRYAKNLLSYEADISDSNVATRVMPIGFDGLLLPEKYVVKPGADPTDYKTVKVEYSSIRAISNPDSPKEGELPLEDAFEALRHAVLSDFESGRFDLKASYQVRFQELSTAEEYKNKSVLEKVYLGDEIKVIHTDEDLQILSRVVAYEWSPIRKEYDEVELGSHIDTFSDIKPTLELIAGKVEQYKTDWENNVDEITELLTTALGGYVLKRPGELLIMDTEDPETATKVWRWNLNGLGYSGTGINGPYETAITMDGRIIAKFIYALNLSSISANLGTVTAGRIQDETSESYWDLDNGEIVLNVKSLKINAKGVATEEDIDSKFSEQQTEIDQNKQDISLRAIATEVEGKILKQSTAPAHLNGRLWLDTSVTPNVLKRSNGSAWVKVTPTTGAEIGLTDEAIVQIVESTSEGLAKKSEITQLDDRLVARFSEIGGSNLIRKTSKYEKPMLVGIYATPLGPLTPLSELGLQPGDYVTFRVYIRAPYSIGAMARINLEYNLNGLDYTAVTGNAIPGQAEGYSTVTVQIPAGCVALTLYIQNGNVGYETNIYYKEPKLEKNRVATAWTPHVEELYTGITEITKEGISVGVSSSSTNTRIAYDGLRVYDGLTEQAYFGESGSYIPELQVNRIYGADVLSTVSGGAPLSVGPGYQYPTITAAINSLNSGNRKARHILDNATIEINVYGTTIDHVILEGWVGGAIQVNFRNGAKILGSFSIIN